jgi:hypothetical protein
VHADNNDLEDESLDDGGGGDAWPKLNVMPIIKASVGGERETGE